LGRALAVPSGPMGQGPRRRKKNAGLEDANSRSEIRSLVSTKGRFASPKPRYNARACATNLQKKKPGTGGAGASPTVGETRRGQKKKSQVKATEHSLLGTVYSESGGAAGLPVSEKATGAPN